MSIPTHNQLKKLSKRLNKIDYIPTPEDMSILHELRMSYRTFLSDVFRVLTHEADVLCNSAICTYRIKRIESIISKLRRYPRMNLTTMEDLAGCRCILSNRTEVFQLVEILKTKFVVERERDYISEPKESGYKSYHLIVSDVSNPNFKIEIQIRSITHHNWATLVEITDRVLQTKLKERANNEELVDFHRILSKSDNEINDKDKARLLKISRKYNYLSRIGKLFIENNERTRSLSSALDNTDDEFFLVQTDNRQVIDFAHFSDFGQAEAAYISCYADLLNNKDHSVNLLLFHSSSNDFRSISTAYSNYFLTFNELFYKLYRYQAELLLKRYHSFRILSFSLETIRLLRITDTLSGHFAAEIVQILMTSAKKGITPKSQKEWEHDINDQLTVVARQLNKIKEALNVKPQNRINIIIWNLIVKGYSRFKHKTRGDARDKSVIEIVRK